MGMFEGKSKTEVKTEAESAPKWFTRFKIDDRIEKAGDFVSERRTATVIYISDVGSVLVRYDPVDEENADRAIDMLGRETLIHDFEGWRPLRTTCPECGTLLG